MSFCTPAMLVIDSSSTEEEDVDKPILIASVCNGRYFIQHEGRPRVSFLISLCGSVDELKYKLRTALSPYFPNGAEIHFS